MIFALLIGPASAEPLVITASECAHIVDHHPAADVAYVPGRDVDGNAVTPADIDGGAALRMPSEIEIAIKIDLNDRLGLPTGATGYNAEAEIGVVRYRDGEMTFNGQPLRSDAKAALIRACREQARNRHGTHTPG